MKKKLLTLMFTLILMLAFATPAFADGPNGAKVIFGENFTLEAEKTLDDDLVVFGGNVTLEENSKVSGDMIVFGGNVNIDGTVDGDIGAIGGNVDVGETAKINGDIGLVGGRVNVADGAEVDGEVKSITELNYDYDGERERGDGGFIVPSPPSPPEAPHAPDFSSSSFRGPDIFGWIGDVIKDIFWIISLVITLGLISWLVAAFMPEQMMTVRQTVTDSTAVSFGLGLMTSVVMLILAPIAALLLITVCLAIVPIVGYTVMGVATLFGWIVIGQIIGERLLSSNGRTMPGFILSTLVGVTILTIITKMPVIGEIPFLGVLVGLVGFLIGMAVSLTGLGAVLLTRFGTRSYPAAPAYAYSGGPSSSYTSGGFGGGGAGVRWTEPAPDVSEEEMPGSEEELNARIKAALKEADKTDEDEPAEDKPKKRKPRRKTPDTEPEDEPEPES